MNEAGIDLNPTIALAVFNPNPFAHLRKARQHLDRAQNQMADSCWAIAALHAHHAAYHATHAYIAAKTGRSSRTPRRVHAQFARLATLAHDVPLPLQRFVSLSLKAISVFEQHEGSDATFAEAAGAVGKAGEFIGLVTASVSTQKVPAKASRSGYP
jgi:hypothetical protein